MVERDLLTIGSGRVLKVSAARQACLIDLAHDRYQTTPGYSLAQILRLPNKSIALPTTEAVNRAPLSEWQSSPSLRWLAGLHLSQGRLISGLHMDSRFKLLHWPPTDVARLSPHIMTLCALVGRPSGATVAEIVAGTNIPERTVLAFINAAYLARAIAVRGFDRESSQPKPAPKATARALFQKIRDRLKGQSK